MTRRESRKLLRDDWPLFQYFSSSQIPLIVSHIFGRQRGAHGARLAPRDFEQVAVEEGFVAAENAKRSLTVCLIGFFS